MNCSVLRHSQMTQLLSEDQKKAFGLDMPSFVKRMNLRLKKIRGDENEDDKMFLSRFHYQNETPSA